MNMVSSSGRLTDLLLHLFVLELEFFVDFPRHVIPLRVLLMCLLELLLKMLYCRVKMMLYSNVVLLVPSLNLTKFTILLHLEQRIASLLLLVMSIDELLHNILFLFILRSYLLYILLKLTLHRSKSFPKALLEKNDLFIVYCNHIFHMIDIRHHCSMVELLQYGSFILYRLQDILLLPYSFVVIMLERSNVIPKLLKFLLA